MTDYTTNFNLEKYQTGDAANLNDQYNASMDIIDDNMYKINTNANTAGGKATQALETAQNNTKNLTALGVTNTATATQLKNKIDNTAETAQNNKSNLNALGINNVDTATNLKNKINKNRQHERTRHMDSIKQKPGGNNATRFFIYIIHHHQSRQHMNDNHHLYNYDTRN
nr:MAG TPA: hypothetical protein [Bacteriophage sp.]